MKQIDIYILNKDWVKIPAGWEFEKSGANEEWYYERCGRDAMFPTSFVENNSEWFTKKEDVGIKVTRMSPSCSVKSSCLSIFFNVCVEDNIPPEKYDAIATAIELVLNERVSSGTDIKAYQEEWIKMRDKLNEVLGSPA